LGELTADPIISPEGTSYPVTGELLVITNHVSSIASISHRLAAHISYHAQQRTHEYISRTVPEIAIYLIETWTTGMLDFLQDLLRLTVGPQPEEGEAFAALSDKVIDLLQRKTAVGSGEGSLVDLIISQTEALQERLDLMAKPSSRLIGAEYDLQVYRIQCTRSHQEKLVSILATIAMSGFVGRGHVVRLVKALRKANRIDCVISGLFAYAFFLPEDARLMLAAFVPWSNLPIRSRPTIAVTR
jgi:nuclear pore complex protein Nup205